MDVARRRTIGDRIMQRGVNPLVRRLLRSPLHDLISARVLLVCLRRRSDGGALSVPVNYLPDGDSLTIVSLARRSWWRNLRGGAPVTVVLEGREREGWGEVVEATPAADAAATRVLIRIDLLPLAARASVPLRGRALWRRWTAAVTVGEGIAFCVPAVVGAGVAALDLGAPATAAALLPAGLAEGAILGLAQALVVRQAVPEVRSGDWVRATALGAGIAWAVALVPMTIGEDIDELAPVVLGLGGLVLGTVFLLSIGVSQWLVLRAKLSRAGWWVPAVAASWIVGLGAFMLFAGPLWHEGQAVGLVVLIGIAGGLIMALAMAASSGLALMHIVRRGA